MKLNTETTTSRRHEIYSFTFKETMCCVISAIFGALAFAFKIALAFLPNVELATFVLMISVLYFKPKIGFLTINTFCGINMIFFGVYDWSIMYFVIFNLYGLIMLSVRGVCHKFWWVFVILIAVMGYIFGTLYAIETVFLYGFNYAVTYWINGLVFDLIHGTANAILGAVLFLPTRRVFVFVQAKYEFLLNKYFLKYCQRLTILNINKKTSRS